MNRHQRRAEAAKKRRARRVAPRPVFTPTLTVPGTYEYESMEIQIAGHRGTFATQRRGPSTELPLSLPWDDGHTDIIEDLRRAAEMMRKAHRETLPELPEWEGPVTPSDYRRAAKIMAKCFEERMEPTPDLLHRILTIRTAAEWKEAFGSEPDPEIFAVEPVHIIQVGTMTLDEEGTERLRSVLAELDTTQATEDHNSEIGDVRT